MRNIALLYNADKPQASSVRQKLNQLLTEAGLSVMHVPTKHDSDILAMEPNVTEAELAIVLGGDGTLLGVARQLAPYAVPLLGINVGHLGFLTESEPSELGPVVSQIIEGQYNLEKRLMIEAAVLRDGAEIARFTALNDAGLGKASFARMVTVEVHVDDVYVDTYRGDGVIVSTPTGSTAYSLSCGGPIVSPQVQVMVLTPICPHTLFSRPCVIDSNQVVRMTVQDMQDDVALMIDGQEGVRMDCGDQIIICKAAFDTILVRLPDREFFDVLREKLHNPGGAH